MIRMTKASVLVFVISILESDQSFAQSADDLVRAHLNRTRQYCGLKFEYDTVEQTGSDPALKLSHELYYFEPLSRNSIAIRRLWVSYRKNPGELFDSDDMLMHEMVGFDGKEGRRLVREYSTENGGWGSPSIPLHQGSVSTFDPGQYKNNSIEEFLTAGPHSITQYASPDGKIFAEHPIKFEIVGTTEMLGMECFVLEGVGPGGINARAVLVNAPGNLPLSYSIGKDGTTVATARVSDVLEFEGMLIPRAGNIHSDAFGKMKSRDFSFEISNVRRAEVPEPYFPEWPTGTSAIGPTGREIAKIPYPPEAIDAVNRQLADRRSVGSYAIRICSVVAVVAAIGLIVRRKLKGQ